MVRFAAVSGLPAISMVAGAQAASKGKPIETPQYFDVQKCKANPSTCRPSRRTCRPVYKCCAYVGNVCTKPCPTMHCY